VCIDLGRRYRIEKIVLTVPFYESWPFVPDRSGSSLASLVARRAKRPFSRLSWRQDLFVDGSPCHLESARAVRGLRDEAKTAHAADAGDRGDAEATNDSSPMGNSTARGGSHAESEFIQGAELFRRYAARGASSSSVWRQYSAAEDVSIVCDNPDASVGRELVLFGDVNVCDLQVWGEAAAAPDGRDADSGEPSGWCGERFLSSFGVESGPGARDRHPELSPRSAIKEAGVLPVAELQTRVDALLRAPEQEIQATTCSRARPPVEGDCLATAEKTYSSPDEAEDMGHDLTSRATAGQQLAELEDNEEELADNKYCDEDLIVSTMLPLQGVDAALIDDSRRACEGKYADSGRRGNVEVEKGPRNMEIASPANGEQGVLGSSYYQYMETTVLINQAHMLKIGLCSPEVIELFDAADERFCLLDDIIARRFVEPNFGVTVDTLRILNRVPLSQA